MNTDAPQFQEPLDPSRATDARRGGFFLICALVAVFAMAIQPVRSPDVWHHVGAGRFVAQNGGSATTDPFSFTAEGRQWLQYEWLAQFLIYGTYRFSGIAGLILFRAIGVALSALFLILAARKRNAGWAAAAIAIALAECAGAERFYSRPEIFTLLIIAAWIWTTERVIAGRIRAAILLPLLMIPWVNVHGAWVAGIAWLGLTCGAETIPLLLGRPSLPKRTVSVLWISFAATLLATLVNPYGIHIWEVPFKLSRSPEVTQRIAEWQRPELHHWLKVRNIGVFVFALAVLLRPRALRLRDGFVILFFGALAFSARRHLQLAMLVTAPIFAHQLAAVAEVNSEKFKNFLSRNVPQIAGVIGVCLAAVIIALGGPLLPRAGWGTNQTVYPVTATEFLADNEIQGNLFNSYAFGNYLLFRLYPESHVFIDGRVDMYGGEIVNLYEKTWQAKEWQETFDRYNIQAAVIEISRGKDIPILDALHASPDWALVYWDNIAAVYVKRSPEHTAFFENAYIYNVRADRVDYALLRSSRAIAIALKDYDRKLEENPTALIALKGRAECALNQGNPEEAVAFMRRALDVQPDSADTIYNLANTLRQLGHTDEAATLFRKAIRLGEYQAESWTGLAGIAVSKKDSAAALECLKKAAQCDPKNWRRHWNISQLAEQTGDLPGAVHAMEEVVRLAPDNAEAKARLESLLEKLHEAEGQ